MNQRLHLSRRGFCLCCLSAPSIVRGVALTPRQAYAEALGIVERIKSAAKTTPITIHRVSGDIAVLEGSGGNIAVLRGPDGKVLVDAGIAASRPQLETALAALGPEPVTHLVNTHWHFDHANGNEWLHELGPRIMAHENTRRHLLSVQRVEDWDYDFQPLSTAALPTDVFAQERALRLNGTTVEMKHYGPAHTDSDLSVHFREPDVLHTGDTFWNGSYPFIDYSTGGSLDGSIDAAEANLAATKDSTVVLSGHGKPVGNRAELREFRDMLVEIRGLVLGYKRKGYSLEAVVAAKPTASHDAKWGRFVIDPALFVRLVYEGV